MARALPHAVAVLLAAVPLTAQTLDSTEFFEKKVRPIFAAQCASCHGAKMQMGGLNLASGAGLTDPLRLAAAVRYDGKVKMPPAGKLPADTIADISAWVEGGAIWPKHAAAPVERISGISEKDRQHWAFRPLTDPAPPAVKNTAWARTPIDRFIAAGLEARNLTPANPAARLTLLRRVTYDLTGLPPTIDEINTFLADSSPNALSTVIERLLASSAYGERWGRQWLDVARYADSTGMDEDHTYPNAWRYRDYVVDAFNRDLPFNQFIVEQIAGDLIKPAKPVATGFLALGPKPLAQQDRVQAIYDVVDEQIDTVSKAFLGITVACARCHDHKFDPILTRDYYSMASIFASTQAYRNLGRPGSVSYLYDAPLDPSENAVYQAHRWKIFGKQMEMEDAYSEDFIREGALERPKLAAYLKAAWMVRFQQAKPTAVADEAHIDAARLNAWVKWLDASNDDQRRAYLKEWLEATPETIEAVSAKLQETYTKSATRWDQRMENWRRRFAVEALQDRDVPERPKPDVAADGLFAAATFAGGPMETQDSPRVATLRREWTLLKETLPPAPAVATGVCDGPSIDQRVFVRGSHHNLGEPVPKAFPIVLAGDTPPKIESGSGRLQLARWIASPDNQLTARVFVNRVWQWHFGEALVRTPNNWGRTGEKPTHPELLDYLASRFIESGWSVKALHRLILATNTYQMDAKADSKAKAADPSNRLWSHFSRTRMSVEQMRDTLLSLGGSLEPAIGGSLLPTDKGKKPRVDPETNLRRTLYTPVRRGSIPALLATFDYGDATTPSDGRNRTNVAPQALFLMNSQFANDRAAEFAKRLTADESLTPKDRVERAYLMALTRKPSAAEIDGALSYVAALEKRLGGPEAAQQAWQSFCHVLISSNEFLYLN